MAAMTATTASSSLMRGGGGSSRDAIILDVSLVRPGGVSVVVIAWGFDWWHWALTTATTESRSLMRRGGSPHATPSPILLNCSQWLTYNYLHLSHYPITHEVFLVLNSRFCFFWVPLFRHLLAWESNMRIDTDDVDLNLLDTVNSNECIYCSVSSYSTASRGCTDLQVSQCDYTTCQNCSSKFCTSCTQELIQSVEGFKNIPTKVKQADKTYRQLMEIQTQVSLGSRTTISGPCCSFVAQEVLSTLVKTPTRPDLTSQCSRIESIKNYRASIWKIKPANLQASPLDNLNLQQYFGDPKVTSSLGAFEPKEHPKQLHTRIFKKRKKHYTSLLFSLGADFAF